MNRKYLSMMLYLILPSTFAQGSDPLARLYEQTRDIQSLHAKMNLNVEGSATETIEVWYDHLHSKLITSRLEMLSTQEALIMVNKDDRWISYQAKENSSMPEAMKFYQLPFDSLMAMETSTQRENTAQGQRVRMTLDHPVVSEMTLLFSTMGDLKQMEYLMNQPQSADQLRVVIEFMELQINPKLSAALFEITEYFQISENNSPRPLTKYANYQLMTLP
ncbi:MAG: hypothetical protein AAF616_13365 [Bacteroidota bacterium]